MNNIITCTDIIFVVCEYVCNNEDLVNFLVLTYRNNNNLLLDIVSRHFGQLIAKRTSLEIYLGFLESVRRNFSRVDISEILSVANNYFNNRSRIIYDRSFSLLDICDDCHKEKKIRRCNCITFSI